MNALAAVERFTEWAVFGLIALVAFLVLIGLANAVVVLYRTLSSKHARFEQDSKSGPLPIGFISTYTYLHLLADVLLVVVAVELMETLLAFENREHPEEYLAGVLGAALVSLARRIIVFFDPESEDVKVGEMYAYAALVAALAAAYAVIVYLA